MHNESSDPVTRSPFEQVATAWSEANSLEALVRPLLAAVVQLTSLDVAYFNVKLDDQALEVRFVSDDPSLALSEGLTVPWEETLCKRCEDAGLSWTDDIDRDLPGTIATQLGIRTFASVPVLSHDGTMVGTLCSASSRSQPLNDATIAELDVIARLIGDWMSYEHRLSQERARADAAEKAVAARAMLIARAEHQLKTPLALLTGWAQMLDERWRELGDVERDQGLEAMRRGSTQLHHHVQRLLDEARADTLIRALELRSVDVGEVATAVTEEIAGLSVAHDISAVVHGSNTALGDVDAIRQVVAHLVENAIKYSPGGGAVVVTVKTVGDGVLVEVRDEGIGVSEGVDVFEPFVRGEAPEGISGSGLGLHIVKSFAVAMGGTVEARRNPDRGSTFTLRLSAAHTGHQVVNDRARRPRAAHAGAG